MKFQNSPWHPAPAGNVQFGKDGTPRSDQFGDIYYSRENGAEEGRHVFLRGNLLPQRWQHHQERSFCIAETGFGTGLNFLLTWQAWRLCKQPKPALHYLSIEKYPLSRKDLETALCGWSELSSLAEQLLANYPGLIPGQHRLVFEQGQIVLDLWWHDVARALPELASNQRAFVDAWYLDGFAPARNTGMWEAATLATTSLLSRSGATLATFTAAGHVRRALLQAGFAMEKVVGFGRKRECLRGDFRNSDRTRAVPRVTPWDLPAEVHPVPEEVVVLGGGLAGCAVAATLARRGIQVTVLERGGLAKEGSGNEQGVLYTRLSTRHSPLADFSIQSYQYAVARYREMFASGALTEGVDGSLCGAFHQNLRGNTSRQLIALLDKVPELAEFLNSDAANTVLGVTQARDGFWFPHAGWLHPAAVCTAMVDHPSISVHQQCGHITLQRIEDQWLAKSERGQSWESTHVVLATGASSAQFEQLKWLPLQVIRGQTTALPTNAEFGQLRVALCHEGYIAPARDGTHSIGATYDLDQMGMLPTAEDNQLNLERLGTALPQWQERLHAQNPEKLGGRVALRCTSPDYLPIAGPVPDRTSFLEHYKELRANARRVIPLAGPYLSGLYLATALGSRGLTSAPLIGEVLASQICGEPPPICRELSRALNPGRFIIRDLCRNLV